MIETSRRAKDSVFFLVTLILISVSDSVLKLPKSILFSLIAMMIFAFFHVGDFAQFYTNHQVIMFSCGLVFMAAVMSNDIKLDTVLNFICVASLIQIAYIGLNFLDYHPERILAWMHDRIPTYKNVPFLKPTGSFLNTGSTGAYIALTVPAFLRKGWIKLAILPIIAVLSTKSSMAIASCIGVVAYYIWLHFKLNKFIPWIAFSATSIAYYIFGFGNIPYLYDQYRRAVWQLATAIVTTTKPFFGYGLGHFAEYFHKYYQVGGFNFRDTHGEYFQALYNFGYVGLVFILYWLFAAIKNEKSPVLLCGLFSFSIISYGHFMFHTSPLAMLALFYWGSSLRRNHVSKLEW